MQNLVNTNNLIDETVSHYQIISLLGTGSMGLVYKAKDLKLNRFVALKFLHPDLEIDDQTKQSLVQEAHAISTLDHPNICTIYEIDQTEDGRLFIAIAYYEGETLKDKILNGPINEDDTVKIIEQIAQGLSKAHQAGIVHRDVKPANIIITSDKLVKIVDFGVAILMQDVKDSRPGGIIGTPTYISPEQAKKKKTDQRSDIWSLGVIFYEMLTGKQPFDKNNDAALIYSIIFDDPIPISNYKPEISLKIQNIINKSLSKDPKNRYQRINEFLSELKKWDKTDSVPSVCILPFKDLSKAKDQQYFAEGLAEEIINKLTQINDLHIISRTSAFKFQGTKIIEIKDQLQVQMVLEGSIRTAGRQLRISTKLIKVEDGSLLWAGKFERELKDIFAIQDEISLAVVKALKIKLLKKEETLIIKRNTDNVNAYTEYLKGRFHWNRRTIAELEKSLKYYQAALEEDSDYAPAYAGLADTYTILGIYGAQSPGEVMPKAISEAKRSMQLDDQLAESHVSLGCVQSVYQWDWKNAKNEFELGIGLNPGYALAYQWYAINYLVPLGKFKEAIEIIGKAIRLDPLSLIINTTIGVIHYFQGSFEEAIDCYNKTLELDPNFAPAHFFLGQSLAQNQMFEESLKHLKIAIDFFGESNNMLATFAYAAAQAGKTEHTEKALNKLLQLSKHKYVSAYDIAMIYIGLGQSKEALKWLEKALEEKAYLMVYLKVDPVMDPLRSKIKFKKILNKMAFPEA
jgi:serine/threonine protein kinase/Tfp pilus assembly protein PilF